MIRTAVLFLILFSPLREILLEVIRMTDLAIIVFRMTKIAAGRMYWMSTWE